ncbi:TPA_exp: Adenylate-forming enzyme AfeA [Trichophyton benhamiae CBS 112371]|uniref:Adenylate-forming enzyme AfeA n=1 Tax=Arthroderma benhamiae (strain ATCC MYA-4681 / CBS 112371) TaxID=663331 RepID=D4AQ47_ARTBC|nr:adenylate-forming enzyme AfeA [Trichophyton benhamiae CBS 112371]EFE34591.1 adenylate-forming enzyme AfeA [Trichophyton benhamiae CBS 112371]DAA77519.1 TPA_exp: Adenylate-forming enzyme AfeA [Trichophyton benhamiae CBS 112371]
MERASNIHTYIKQTKCEALTVVAISCDAKALDETERAIEIDHNCVMAPGGPGMIIFTSGTTGRPKGALLPRCALLGTGIREPGSAALVYRPNHWIGGARDIIQSLLSGMKVHSLKTKVQDARAEDVLRAFRTSQITHAAFMPDVLRRMMFLLTCHRDLSSILQEEKDLWYSYFKGLSIIKCSGGSLEPPVRDFWIGLTGLPFENFYSSTELGGSAIGGLSEAYGSMGTPIPGIKVKLSEGDRGELCVKSPKMLLRYIGDNHTVESIFDEEGYYKTGDLAKYVDGEYIFAGRVATDCVQYAAFRFSTLAVEDSLTKLPYISEACVVAVPHRKLRQLCGAVVKLRPDTQLPSNTTTLGLIRSDLEGSLPTYMMPTLLKLLKDGEEWPSTVIGKPEKKEILRIYFGSTNGAPVENYPPEVESCPIPKPGEATKPWDWDGRQFEH